METIIIFSTFILGLLFALAGFKKLTSLLGILFILGIMGIQKENLSNTLFRIIFISFIWVLAIILSRLLRKTHATTLANLDQQIHLKEESIRSLSLSDTVIQEESKTLEQSSYQTEALYESLKELNKTLEFSKTVEVFSHLVSRLTSFEKGWLILTNHSEKSDQHPICYQIFRNEQPICKREPAKNLLSEYELEVLSLSMKSQSIIFLNHPEKDPRIHSRNVPIDSLKLSGIGLFHEGLPVGVLLLEGCKKNELEPLEILAIQLSMEIEKTRLYEKVKNLSILDGLTHTYQRRHLMILLEDEIKRMEKQEKTCSVLLLDIDHFKGFNDNFGHLVGDILIRDLSSGIQENLRPMDLVGRYGGEEFVIALPETSPGEALQIAERIRSDIQARNFIIHDKLFKLTLSIGIATYPDQSKNLHELFEKADKALYQAKTSGRNQVVLYKN